MDNNVKKVRWVHSASTDFWFILSPPFLVTLIVLALSSIISDAHVNAWQWLFLVLFIDVGHVWSTIFRTYLDLDFKKRHALLFIVVPIICLVSTLLLYQMGFMVFWRVMAYMAVFHFVRQQYGFMKMYTPRPVRFRYEQQFDNLVIYAATLYPILKWHLSDSKAFHWFLKGDFVYFESIFLGDAIDVLYVVIAVCYGLKEIVLWRPVYWAKNMIVLGTGLSWYVGIVAFDSDLIFTSINVVSHGVPYMALVYLKAKKRSKQRNVFSNVLQSIFQVRISIFIFCALLFVLAFFEELLWDALVWRDHYAFFGWLSGTVSLDQESWMFIVPILSVPQLTHYVLDGFIWKKNFEVNPR